MPKKDRPTRQLTFAEMADRAWGLTPAGKRRVERRERREARHAARAATQPAQPAAPTRPSFPMADLMLDEDYARCLRAAGIQPDGVQTLSTGMNRRPTTAADLALSRRTADLFVEDMARFRDQERAARIAALPEFDALTATPDAVRERAEALGLDVAQLDVQPRPPERPAEPPRSDDLQRRMRELHERDEEIAGLAADALARGVRVDFRKLSARQVQLVLRRRGVC